MALLGGFLGQVGYQAGQNIVIGQQQDEQKAQTEYKQQQVAQMKMATLAAKQQQQTQQEIGAYLKSETDKDSSILQDPLKTAAAYERAAGMAAAHGDFASMQEMGKLAKGKLDEAKEAQAVALKNNKEAKEGAASAAYDYDSAPTVDNAAKLAQAAVKAGYDPTKIPAPGTLQFQAFANNLKTNALDAKTRANLVEKAQEFQIRQQDKREEFVQREQDRQDARRDRAMYQQAMLEDRRARREESGGKPPTVKEFEGGQYEYEPSGKIQGERLGTDPRWVKISDPKLTSQQKTGISKLNSSSGEVARSLTNFSEMDFDTRASPFAGLGAHSPLDALMKTGTNALTPTQVQSMTVAGGGMGNQIAQAESAFGGRMMAGAQQEHMESITTPKQGDTGYTAAYKLANGKELMLALIDNSPASYRNSKDAQAQRDKLNKAVPWSTSDVIEQTRRNAPKQVKTLNEWSKDSIQIKEHLTDSIQNPTAAAGADTTPGLPGNTDTGRYNQPPLPPPAAKPAASSAPVSKAQQDSLFAKYGLK